MNKLKMHSPNLTEDNIARIREMFPGCLTEAEENLLVQLYTQIKASLETKVPPLSVRT